MDESFLMVETFLFIILLSKRHFNYKIPTGEAHAKIVEYYQYKKILY